jgi:hypothetical protein
MPLFGFTGPESLWRRGPMQSGTRRIVTDKGGVIVATLGGKDQFA